MKRRSVIKRVCLLGGMFSPVSMALIEACTSRPEDSSSLNDEDQEKLLNSIAATLVPETASTDGRTVGIAAFVTMMIRECYAPEEYEEFLDGLNQVEMESSSRYESGFSLLDDARRAELFSTLAAQDSNGVWKRFFKRVRELVFLGYYTSEIGVAKALDYLPTPGRYEPCIDLVPGKKSWIY